LASTNVTLPRSDWTRIATNQFDANGGFVFSGPINPNALQTYYALQLPPN
jgi:hypothetical protein